MKKSTIKHIILIGLCLFSFGCTSNIEQIKLAYQAGQYEQIARLLQDEIKKEPIETETLEFIHIHGQLVITKAIKKGILMYQKKEYVACIQFLGAYMSILESFEQINAYPKLVESHIDQTLNWIAKAKEQYVIQEYQLANRAFVQHQFRTSYQHYSNVHYYVNHYKDSIEKSTQAFTKAQRHLSITPFIKLADPFSLFINKSLSKIFKQLPQNNLEWVGLPLMLNGEDMVPHYNQLILEMINQKKSKFLHVTYDKIIDKISHSHYYMEGIIDVIENDSLRSPTEQTRSSTLRYRYKATETWQDFPFNYSLKTTQYGVKFRVKADIYLTDSDKRVGSIYFDKGFKDTYIVRGNALNAPPGSAIIQFPDDYLSMPTTVQNANKQYVINQALQIAANEFVEQLLKLVDIETDPFIYYTHQDSQDI